jgi:hypothetical protein
MLYTPTKYFACIMRASLHLSTFAYEQSNAEVFALDQISASPAQSS